MIQGMSWKGFFRHKGLLLNPSARAKKRHFLMVKWSNYFKLMMVKCSLMMVKCSSMMVKWVYDHTLISPSLTIIGLKLTIIRSFDFHWENVPTAVLVQKRVINMNVYRKITSLKFHELHLKNSYICTPNCDKLSKIIDLSWIKVGKIVFK